MAIKSLPALKIERAGLLAMQAKRDYEEALAATCGQKEAIQAGQAVRAAWLDAVDGLVESVLLALGDERDETRVHYLMTDAVHEFLARMGRLAAAASGALEDFGAAVQSGVKPRGLMTVSQWADRYRVMRTGTNLPGPWHTANAPYLREIMDSLSEHSPVTEVDFVKSVQVGATEIIYNWLGYIMHNLQNKDVLVVVPSKEYRDQKFNPRLNRTLEESPALKELITFASRNRKNAADVIEYGIGAKIVKAGANVSTDLRSDPIPYIVCDEVDEFPAEIPGSGDPMTLVEGRQTTFSRPKTFRVSTPKEEHASRIQAGYNKSDRRRYHVPCPHCGHKQPLEWGRLKYDVSRIEGQEDVPESERVRRVTAVWYECANCHAAIDEGHKSAMLAAGVWIAQRPAVKTHRGYHINSLYAPVGLGKGWKWLAEKWLAIQGDTASLQAFVNERLGEVWREIGDSLEPAGLITRKAAYPAGRRVLARTAWADVQKDRIEYTVCEWGQGEECWPVAHVIVPGETAGLEVWDELGAQWDELDLDAAGVDAGYNTTQVKAFVGPRKWCFATKGVPGAGRAIVEDVLKRAQRLRKRRKINVQIEPVGVDNAKAVIFSRLKKTAPGPEYIHFPDAPDFDDEYFQQLTAERLVTKMRGTRPYSEWVQIRPRNEALDCMVGNLAVLRLAINLEKKDRETPASAAHNETGATPATPAGETPAPIKPAQPVQRLLGRRVARSSFLSR